MISLRRQRGFIYLYTGANGTGKTAFGLREVRAKQLAENRPVAYNGRFRMKADFGWKQIDAKDWQKEPDGTIFFFDECHNDFPPGTAGKEPPEIKMLAEHRVRGFDFYLFTQHPKNINAFIRRIIASPGWHKHLKRNFGTKLVSHIDYVAVCDNPEKPGAGSSGTVSIKALPTEVYDWYESAELHTGKVKIPKQLWIILFCLLAVPLLIFFFIKVFYGNLAKKAGGDVLKSQPAVMASASPRQSGGSVGDERRVLTPLEYAQSFVPRLEGLPHTAPRYDGLNSPVQSPRPAACLDGVRRGTKVRTCECFTQQATRLQVPDAVCRQIASGGYFDDTLPPPRDARESFTTARSAPVLTQSTPEPSSLSVMGASPVLPPPEVKSVVAQDEQVRQFMRKRQYIQ